MRTVVDTGVVVSALLLPHSVPRQAFDAATKRGKLLVSAATIAELDEVLRRAKFNRYVREDLRLEFLAALVREAEEIEIVESVHECRDVKDDKFLELVANSRATHLITGDADLLALHPFRGIPILDPKAFLDVIGVSGD
jgi:putative PIN family toxin of toxin-antitoxin system